MNRRLPLALLVAVLFVLAGCAGDGMSPEPTPTTTLTPEPDDDTNMTVTVTDVVDGDTIDVRFENGSTDTVRLLGVDTPEVEGGVTPGEFEGVPNTAAGRECLETWGDRASAYASDRLDGETVTLVFDETTDRRGSFGRLLAYVRVGGESFNHDLVAEGYARVYDSTFAQSERFYRAESDAQATGKRLWECQTAMTQTPRQTTLQIVEIHEDAAGNDNDNLNDEYVIFRNDGADPLDLTGWRVEDESGHTYRFPDGFTLAPDAAVTLYTGVGEDTETGLYWGRGGAVWNNAGDTIFVYDDAGRLVVERPY